MSAPVSHLPIKPGQPFRKATEDEYYAFVKNYLLAGGSLDPMTVTNYGHGRDVFVAAPSDQSKIYKNEHPKFVYYLFESSHHLIKPETGSNIRFLSLDEPMSYHPPPYITVEIIKRLKADLGTDPLIAFFNGNILDYLILVEHFKSEGYRSPSTSVLIDHLLDTKSTAEIQKILDQNNINRNSGDYSRISDFKYSFNRNSGQTTFVTDAISQKENIFYSLKKKLDALVDLQNKIENWQPFTVSEARKPAPQRTRWKTYTLSPPPKKEVHHPTNFEIMRDARKNYWKR